MNPRRRVAKGVAEALYLEGRSEVEFVDRLLEGWQWLARNDGTPNQLTHCSLASLSKPDPEATSAAVTAARARALELNDAQFAAIDRVLVKLPPPLRRVIEVEYWSWAPSSAKARRMGLNRHDYRTRLAAAQWAVYVALMPDVERWRSIYESTKDRR